MANSPDDLMDEAWECLNSFDTDRALSIGHKLIDMRYSGGFEIAALAYAQNDQLDEAIKTLEIGVKEAPTVWLLWQLLANYYSDDDRYAEAMACYQRALDCPHVDRSSVHLNIAISLARQGEFDRSNVELTFVVGEQTRARREAIRLGNYAGLGRWKDILTEAPRVVTEIEELADDDDTYLPDDLGRIYARWAQARLKTGDVEGAAITARKAILYNKDSDLALEIIREIKDERRGPNDRMFKLLVEGQWFEPFEDEYEIPRFYTTYWVVAESEKEALQYAQELEPDGVGNTLRVDECEKQPVEDWQQLRGVYSRSAYAFFQED